MALERFIKTVWIANIMQSLQKTHVFASLANTAYKGVLKNLGDQVHIMSIGDIQTKPYSKDTDISTPDDVQDATTRLVADQAYYFNFKVNDVEAVQEKTNLLVEATNNAAYGFRDNVDKYFASLHAQAGLHSYSSGTTPWEVNSLNAEDVLLELNELAGTNNVPREGRFLIVPEWFHTKLVLSGLAIKTSNDALYQNGFVERVLNWDIYISNNIEHSSLNTHAKIFGGIKNKSFSFADVISNIEAYRPEKRFEDAVKGLYVFGGKIIRPDMTLVLHASKVAEP